MKRSRTVTIKELHAKTGQVVRQAGQSKTPVQITDRGKPVALLTSPNAMKTARGRKRVLLPEYKKLLRQQGSGSVTEDLDAVREGR